jgi:hypothetical protein
VRLSQVEGAHRCQMPWSVLTQNSPAAASVLVAIERDALAEPSWFT